MRPLRAARAVLVLVLTCGLHACGATESSRGACYYTTTSGFLCTQEDEPERCQEVARSEWARRSPSSRDWAFVKGCACPDDPDACEAAEGVPEWAR